MGGYVPAASSVLTPKTKPTQGVKDWTPAVLDVAARAAAPDAQETAALLALLRRRWPSLVGSADPAAPDEAGADGVGGSGDSGSDDAQQQGAQSLLELTAAVYRRGGARGPGEASRLPALVALFVTLQQPEQGEEGEEPPPWFLGANDGVAYLQVRVCVCVRQACLDGWSVGRIDPSPHL